MIRYIQRFPPAQVYVILFVLCSGVFPIHALAEPVDRQKVSPEILRVLSQHFQMRAVIELIQSSPDRASSKRYLQGQNRFHFVATQRRGSMVLDGYSVSDGQAAPVIGYSIFYYGTDGPLAIADLSVNILIAKAKAQVEFLIGKALDSVSSPDGSTLHFLGIYDLDPKRILKIMVRKATTPIGPDYAIRYAVSGR